MTAIDPDAGNRVTYRLDQGDRTRFLLLPSTGELFYGGFGEAATDEGDPIALTVTARDAAGLTASAEVAITVKPALGPPTFAQDTWTFRLPENTSGPLALGTLSATDPDGTRSTSPSPAATRTAASPSTGTAASCVTPARARTPRRRTPATRSR